jgi:hypothetical protein
MTLLVAVAAGIAGAWAAAEGGERAGRTFRSDELSGAPQDAGRSSSGRATQPVRDGKPPALERASRPAPALITRRRPSADSPRDAERYAGRDCETATLHHTPKESTVSSLTRGVAPAKGSSRIVESCAPDEQRPLVEPPRRGATKPEASSFAVPGRVSLELETDPAAAPLTAASIRPAAAASGARARPDEHEETEHRPPRSALRLKAPRTAEPPAATPQRAEPAVAKKQAAGKRPPPPRITIRSAFQEPASDLPDDLRPIQEVTIETRPEAGTQPDDLAAFRFARAGMIYGDTALVGRFTPRVHNWAATGLCYSPLYFEEVNLERYGNSFGVAQPLISGAHFFATVPLVPYLLVAAPQTECVYTLGHYRPGNYVPYQIHWPRASFAAGVVEGGVITGLIYLIP